MIDPTNYRPPSKVPLRRSTHSPWRTIAVVAAVAIAYGVAQFSTDYGDRMAMRAENADLREKIRQHNECVAWKYQYPRVPTYTPRPRKGELNAAPAN